MKYVLAIITLTLMAFMLSLDVSAQNGPPAEFVDGVVLVKFFSFIVRYNSFWSRRSVTK